MAGANLSRKGWARPGPAMPPALPRAGGRPRDGTNGTCVPTGWTADVRAPRIPLDHERTPGDRAMADHAVDHIQKPLAHGCPAGSDHDREVPEIDLLSPL